MIQKKKKQLRIIVLVALIIILIGAGIWGIINATKSSESENTSETQSDISFELKRLIIESKLTKEELEAELNLANINLELDGEAGETKIYSVEYATEEETKQAYEELKENKKIISVHPDEIRTMNGEICKIFYFGNSTVSFTSWGAISMGLDETEQVIDAKSGNPEIVVAVIDSGFNTEHTFVVENLSDRVLPGYNAIEQNTDITDNSGHGTNVGGIILEGAPDNVKIMPIKALDVNEEGEATGTSLALIRAVTYAINNGADIINMSIGGATAIPQEQTIINRANSDGIICVVASGNDGLDLDVSGNNCYPAEFENVITVGAVRTTLMSVSSSGQLTQDNMLNIFAGEYDTYKNTTANNVTLASFSNYGECIDYVAPGVLLFGLTKDSSYASYDGTSQASPHIAAAVATIKTYNPDYTLEQIEEILTYYVQDLGDEGKDVLYGNGFVSFKDYEECSCGGDNCDEIFCFGCTNSACKFHPGRTNKLSSIAISTPPNKTEYLKTEEFDPTGMVVTANYSDNTTATVTNYTYSASPWLSVTTAESGYDIEISYTEDGVTRKATQSVTILEEKVLTAIDITTAPIKTIYQEGETFDRAGMVVTASYSDDTTAPITNYTYSPTTALTTNDTVITVTYTEGDVTVTDTLDITVNATQETEKVLTAIDITTAPIKTIYQEGETFDRAGMVVTASYSDDTTAPITNYTYSPTTALTTNDTVITVTYTEGDITVTDTLDITVNAATENPPATEDETELSSITVTTRPRKTSYTAGDVFDPTGMVITARYSDGTMKTVTDYRYSPTVALRVSDTVITISYTEDGVTKTTTTPITVKAASTNNGGSNLLDDPMFQVEVPDDLNVGGTTGSSSSSGKTDAVTVDQEIPYTGPEETILPIAIVGVSIVMVVSFVSYRKYKDIK